MEQAGPLLDLAADPVGRVVADAGPPGHHGEQVVLLEPGDDDGASHRVVDRVLAVVVDDHPHAGQLVRGVAPRDRDGLVEVHRLVREHPLDLAGQAGVPLEREGGEQVELVAEGRGDAGDVHRQQAVTADGGGRDHGAEGLAP
ncbi:hypothetical protein FQZ97_1060680 [compost metagenome]